MNPELFKNVPNVIVQGVTGTHGSFHAKTMLEYGTNIVAGTSPNKAGETIHGVPVYGSIADIQADHRVDASVIFVPAKFAKSAVIEAIDAKIPLIVIITEGIPVHDMLQINQHKQGSSSVVIGPNCPGVLVPGSHLLGIIPARLSTPGKTAIVSRSGTLTYEAMDGLTRRGIGQSHVVGIGGDRVQGTSFVDCLQLFEADDNVERILLIGEIGGTSEIAAAEFIASSMTKPVYAYVAGHSAPAGVQLGHAGAILGTNQLETARAKTDALEQAGATTADSLPELLEKMV
jgi:succinyl-CoA synthetase alpha subunit